LGKPAHATGSRPEGRLRVVLSYAHRDERLRQELAKHLSPLRRSALIDLWYDGRIVAGAELHSEIQRHLETADLVLLLISPDFITSDFCYCRELRAALQRHAKGLSRVIPIILRPVDWLTTPIGKLLAVPKDGKPVTKWQHRDDAFLEIATSVRAIAEQILASQDTIAHGPAMLPTRPPSGQTTGPLRQRTKRKAS
jgi:hypothetical protein